MQLKTDNFFIELDENCSNIRDLKTNREFHLQGIPHIQLLEILNSHDPRFPDYRDSKIQRLLES